MITLLLSISLAYAEELSLNYQEALDLALDQNPQFKMPNGQSMALAAVMSAKALLTPRCSSAGQNRNTRQQFFAGIGAHPETYGPPVTIGGRTTLPTGTTLSVDWTTSRSTSTTSRVLRVQQEISPIDTTLTMTLTQSLLQGFKRSTTSSIELGSSKSRHQ